MQTRMKSGTGIVPQRHSLSLITLFIQDSSFLQLSAAGLHHPREAPPINLLVSENKMYSQGGLGGGQAPVLRLWLELLVLRPKTATC